MNVNLYNAMRYLYGMPRHGARVETPKMTDVAVLVRRIVIHLSNGGQW
jgi:hypothetical protein